MYLEVHISFLYIVYYILNTFLSLINEQKFSRQFTKTQFDLCIEFRIFQKNSIQQAGGGWAEGDIFLKSKSYVRLIYQFFMFLFFQGCQ